MDPLCFVLMPFGQKPDAAGLVLNFDAIYRDLLWPAIELAGMEPIRADEEQVGGIIHKPMFERLILCEYAIADLTTANANVFYELGVRHAVRPGSTLLVFAKNSRLPFDVAPLRGVPYEVTPDGLPAKIDETKAMFAERLRTSREAIAKVGKDIDSPIYQMVDGYPDVDHTKTDVFRDHVQYSKTLKERLAAARKQGIDAIRRLDKELGDLTNLESGVLVDLFLSYRSAKGWNDMIDLANRMPKPVAESVMMQEQLALALNRAGKGAEAEDILINLLDRRGATSETYGILGRIYKDRWESALKAGETFLARGLMEKAIDAYRRGFEADWRDAYPGINAVTLMEIRDPPDPQREQLLPVVAYSVERRISAGKPDYWDHATLLELAVLAKDQDKAAEALAHSLAAVREPWEPETTARNLRLIREARMRRGDQPAWADEIEASLTRSAR